MREILFRGQRIDTGEWVFGQLIKIYFNGKVEYCIQYKDIQYEMLPICDVIQDTIGQYTGCKDKNNVSIFEGDIVNQEKWVSVGKYEPTVSIVKYKGVCFTCECTGDWSGSNTDLNGLATIIGNIYETPELLNQK